METWVKKIIKCEGGKIMKDKCVCPKNTKLVKGKCEKKKNK